ncbi:Crp/Fnr family transcriptional regulator [Chrysiogenes arsenatis]|uniref:Crp/Fnr family transcriptional regulator n=1 Tax=Chrysiogenes arsenatis TaxID=309797 RepID=UPI0004805C0E|nr:Crp/Fnr family transcriptional regulator [Chrysiogenes arsenatis]
MEKKEALLKFQTKYLGSADPEITKFLFPICTLVEKGKKELLFLEGDEGEYVWFLLKGTIKLFRTTAEGKEVIVHFVYAGEMFAEILLLKGTNYPVNSQALEPIIALGISARGLHELVKTQPDFALRYIGNLSMRLKYFVGLVENLTTGDVSTKFINYLKLLRKKEGKRNVVTLPVPKGDIAVLLGTTPETFSRILKKLSLEGIIAVKGKDIELLDEE